MFMARIFCIANQKGGVGKTTTAINLATGLAVAEKRTLLIDFDPQANTTSGLGVQSRGLERTIYPVLMDEIPIEEAILPTEVATLHLIPSTRELAGAV